MEFSPKEKERIIADEKLRYETVKSLQVQGGGKCCTCHAGAMGAHGSCTCHSFLKGLILGVGLTALLCFLIGHCHDGNRWGSCTYGNVPMTSHSDIPAQVK